MASSGFSFSPDSLAGAIVAEKNKKNKNLIFGLEKLFAQWTASFLMLSFNVNKLLNSMPSCLD